MSAKSRRLSRSGRRENRKTAELSWSEMTADQREQELLQWLDSLSRLPPSKPKRIVPGNIDRAARRGARKARRFLAGNPTQESIQASWDIYSWELHSFDDSPVSFAYHAAYLQTLRPRVSVPPLAKEKNARPILTIMADFGMGRLWLNWIGDDSFGVGGSCCDSVGRCGSHPMSDALFEAFNAWIAEFGAAPWSEGSLSDPGDPNSDYVIRPRMILNWPDFHTRGLALARRLKGEVGPAFRVIYEKPREDPAHRDQERREVLDDGSVVLLPPKRPGHMGPAAC